MEPATAPVRLSIASRIVSCLWCHQATTHHDVTRNRGLCGNCVRDNVETSWRLIYDRDRHIGAIPSNLRVAYRL